MTRHVMKPSEYINHITFIYDTIVDTCQVQARGRPVRELTIKGTTEYLGEANGTWFQVDEKINHWISFKKDKFHLNVWEVFYKCVQSNKITYYRHLLSVENALLTCSFTEQNEWVKDENGKWKSKFN